MNILITGTSSGIGSGLAMHYLKKDHIVYGISRRNNEVLDRYSNFRFLSQDLSDFDTTGKTIPKLLEHVDILDLVILNAGVLGKINDLQDTSLEEIKKVMDINVWSNKVIIDTIFKNVDSIRQVVGISSGAAVSGSRGWNAYSLSKAALNMMIDLYAKEHEETHFSALAPGIIDTDMQDYIATIGEEDKFPVVKYLKSMKGTTEMPSADEVAADLAEAMEELTRYESGSFHDVRKMD